MFVENAKKVNNVLNLRNYPKYQKSLFQMLLQNSKHLTSKYVSFI